MKTSWSLVGAAIRVRTVVRRPVSDRWNVDAVKAMQASARVPNPENLRQASVMPERLTTKLEVARCGSKIHEQVRRFEELKFREFKITKGILEKFGLSDNCKGCQAAASGTHARRHTDDCRQRLEQLIRDDEVLRARLDLRDVRHNRDSQVRKTQVPRRIEGGSADGEAEAAGGKAAEDLLVNEKISSMLRHSKKKLRTPIVKMLTTSVTEAEKKPSGQVS